MNLWKTVPFATAVLVLQAQTPVILSTPAPRPGAVTPSTAQPLYRISIVQGSAKAINYSKLKGSTEVDLKGTVLAPLAEGEAKVKHEDGGLQVTLKVKHLPAASGFGGEYLTYVLWGISPEGRPTNLGELVVEKGKAKVKAMEPMQSFGLIVTAEPYFAVTRPSDAVIMENVMGKETKGQVEVIEAKYELLKRGQYALNMENAEPIRMDGKTPFEVYQARNAVKIARGAGANAFAPEAYLKAESYLKLAETDEGGKKGRVLNAREAVQRAEDARAIAAQRQDEERVAMDKSLAQGRLDDANRATQVANANAAAAALDAASAAVRAKDEANLQTQAMASENEGLRGRLMDQLSAVLKTRSTARGLIVNMSGMLFHTGKSTLVPEAREKLAKVAGILSTHKGLRIEVDGFTDSTGTEASNQKLSEARAQTTRDYLVSQGVAADAITSKGYGEADPIAPNTTDTGRKENRRVELVVTGAGMAEAKS